MQQKTKFARKYLVWQAIAGDGDVSEPLITTGTIDSKIYLEECVNKRLLPFLRKKEGTRPILFWPDLTALFHNGGRLLKN